MAVAGWLSGQLAGNLAAEPQYSINYIGAYLAYCHSIKAPLIHIIYK